MCIYITVIKIRIKMSLKSKIKFAEAFILGCVLLLDYLLSNRSESKTIFLKERTRVWRHDLGIFRRLRYLEDVPLEDSSAEGAPEEGAPLEHAPLEDDPLEDDPLEDDPLEEDPLEDDPLEDDPLEGTPL